MSDRADLAALLPSIEAVDALPCESLPAFVAGLAALQARAAVRLTVPGAPPPSNGAAGLEVVEDVHEVALLVRRSVSWVRKRGHRLPGFQQPGGKGTRVAWSRAALRTWANGGLASHT
jgi:hypothetical protein